MIITETMLDAAVAAKVRFYNRGGHDRGWTVQKLPANLRRQYREEALEMLQAALRESKEAA